MVKEEAAVSEGGLVEERWKRHRWKLRWSSRCSQGGEEEVWQPGAIVRGAGRAGVVCEKFGPLVFYEQVLGDEVLFFEKPEEEQADNQTDEMLFGAPGLVAGCGELRLVAGALQPSEERALEALAEFLGVSGIKPCLEQVVKVAGLAVVAHPWGGRLQRQANQDVQMGALRAEQRIARTRETWLRTSRLGLRWLGRR